MLIVAPEIWMGILFVLGTYVLIGLTTKKPCLLDVFVSCQFQNVDTVWEATMKLVSVEWRSGVLRTFAVAPCV